MFLLVVKRALFCCFLLLPFIGFAQSLDKYQNIESNNIRIDPRWIELNDCHEFIWAYDVVADKDGNTYSTGYFKKHLFVNGNYLAPSCKATANCNEILFIIKRNEAGKFIWIRYINGQSRPARLAISPTNKLVLLGTLYSNKASFSTADTSVIPIKMESQYGCTSFLAEYDLNGTLLRVKLHNEKPNFTANNLVVTPNNQVIMVGTYEFRSYKRPSLVQRSYYVESWDANWNPLWIKMGDTTSNSILSSVGIDDHTTIIVSGSYTNKLLIGNKKFECENYDGVPFVAAFNQYGQFLWCNDSLNKNKNGYASNVVVDSKGNSYALISSSYSFADLTKLDKNGNKVWSQRFSSKATIYMERMLIDAKDQIYICGESYGALFPSKAAAQYSFVSKGGTDIFMAQYTTEGGCKWLKVGGGKGTDYCKAITLHRNNLYAWGWFDYYMEFNQLQIKEVKGNTFWLGQFDLDELAYINDKPLKQVTKQVVLENEAASNLNCECSQGKGTKPTFVPTLTALAELNEIQKASNWKFITEKSYNSLFYRNFQFSTGTNSAFYSLELLAFDPLVLTPNDNSFQLNLTPCKNSENFSSLALSVGKEQAIIRYLPSFEWDDFDHSAKAYLEVLYEISETDHEHLLKQLLFDRELTNLPAFIQKVNLKYHCVIPLNSNEPEEFIKAMLEEFEKRNIYPNDFILNEFILSENGTHRITQTEQERLRKLFYEIISNRPFSELDNFLKPQFNIDFDTKFISLQVNANVLRKWDLIGNRALLNNKGQYEAVPMLATVKGTNFTTKLGFQTTISAICMPKAELSGTGILLVASNAQLINNNTDRERSMIHLRQFKYISNQYNTKSKSAWPNEQTFIYDSLLDNFSGIALTAVNFTIPFKNTFILGVSKEFLINNKIVSGIIQIPLSRQGNVNLPAAHYRVQTENEAMTISTDELEAFFKAKGFNEVNVVQNDNFLDIKLFRRY